MSTIAIGSDHAGFELKTVITRWLLDHDYHVVDVGTESADRCDYPDFGEAVGEEIAAGRADTGVAICGSGQGIAMAANKVPGIRAGVIRDDFDAEMTRRHNDANVACFGERVTSPEEAVRLLEIFLNAPFDGGRHAGRVEKLNAQGR